ncbi:MAG: hypothetical protein JO147_10065 [Actinobacteria bacterium]|nr:hypothetical protein [Actinomycetota bacterium]
MLGERGLAAVTRALRPRDTATALARVIGPAELPEGRWDVTEQITLRIGPLTGAAPWALNARSAGELSALRVFVDRTLGRTVSVQATTLASAEDARAALDWFRERMQRSLARRGRTIDQQDVEPPAVPAVDATWAHEQFVSGYGYRLTLGATRAEKLVLVHARGRHYTWAWPELVDILETQLAKGANCGKRGTEQNQGHD